MNLYYTYKVTFPGFKWFYYGYHKDNGKNYYGSPVTHKWIWDFYECEVQILEWFPSVEEAQMLEKRLIRPFLRDPNCLNENCGGLISREALVRGSKKAILITNEWWKGQDPKRRSAVASKAGKVGGRKNVESGNLARARSFRDQQEHSEWGKKLANITNSLLYLCPCCDKKCNIGGITRHLSAKSNSCSGEPIPYTR